jgi:hypothetical protein
VTQLVHHGMVFVPTGYTYGGKWGSQTVYNHVATSPPCHHCQQQMLQAMTYLPVYSAGCLAGPTGARQPNEHELGYAKHQVGACLCTALPGQAEHPSAGCCCCRCVMSCARAWPQCP